MSLEIRTINFQDAIYTGFLKSDKYLKQLKKRMSYELFGGGGIQRVDLVVCLFSQK